MTAMLAERGVASVHLLLLLFLVCGLLLATPSVSRAVLCRQMRAVLLDATRLLRVPSSLAGSVEPAVLVLGPPVAHGAALPRQQDPAAPGRQRPRAPGC
ncbi:DUF6412 domain-containing protein [Streptomyces sp. NPDC102381]|uniref:DUF6412 domain-containing protein n=1 Tax=Streptomyces sp. NPDC102381 TaxID=3366164 RepID=UPI0037F73295